MRKNLLTCLLFLAAIFTNAQITLGSGTSTGAYPIASNWGYNYTQQIISKASINAANGGAGNITGLRFYLPASAVLDKSNQWEVYIGHTSLVSFSAATAASWIPVSSMTQVFTGTIANVGGAVEVTFSTPFAYNNVDNLVIAVHENTPDFNSSSDYFYTSNSGVSNSSIYYRNDTTDFNPAAPIAAGGRAGTLSNVTLMGLTPTAAPSCVAISAPANAATAVSLTPTISWATSPSASSYDLKIGTTPGGTNILNTNVGLVTSYTLPTALAYITTYYVTIVPKNSLGSASGCTETTFTTRNIACPSVSAPSSAATGVSITPTITWSAVSDATGYKISIGTTAGGTDILNNFNVGNVTTYTHNTALNHNTKYYYTVNSYNASATSSSCTERNFTTLTLCPSVTTPSSASATGVSINPTFAWTAIGGATGYKISIGTTAGATDILNAFDLGNVTTYTHNTALNYNTKYYYTITGYSATQTGTACTERNFTTVTLCPSVSAPSSGATGVSTTPTFTWTAVPGATGYKISIGTTAGGTDILNASDLGNVTTYTHNTALNYNTKYYYTISGYTPTQSAASCTERNFTTMPLCPSVSAPSSAATNVSITPTFTWAAVSGATGYRISIGTTTGGTDIMNNVDVGNVITYTLPTPLAFSTKYYYTVNGYSGGLSSTGCSERTFTTQGSCPIVNYPADAATLQPIRPTIKWNSISTATSYTLTVGTTAGGSDIMNNVDVGNVTSYTFVTPLTLGTKYYYKVNTNTSSACTERTLTVNAVAAPANDECSGALVASSFPYTYAQTDGAGSTNGSGFVSTCSGGSNDGMWFKFTGDGGSITVKATTTTSFDHKVSVYSGTCGALTCIGSVDDALSSSGNSETYTFNSVAGTQYYVNVAYYSGTTDSAEGNFNMSITSSLTLGTTDIQAPKAKEGIKAYPNPFVDDLNISDISNVKSISVIDLSGRLVKTIDKPSSNLHLGDLKQGMYLVSLEMKDGSRQVIKTIKR